VRRVISFNLSQALSDTLTRRISLFAGKQRCWLAVGLTITTVDPHTGQAAVTCPVCWDAAEGRPSVENDPTCLGTGFIVPASGTVRQQAGYLNPVPIQAFIVENEQHTEQSEQGIVQYAQDTLYYTGGETVVKKGDAIIRVVFPERATTRFVVGDMLAPHVLGGQVLMGSPALERRAHGNPIYAIPLADPTPDAAGTWEG